MVKVLIRGNWAPYVGTDYTDALGIYDSLAEAREDAEHYAWDRWEGAEEAADDDDDFEDEGPDYTVIEYNPLEGHDDERSGGGSFEDDFARMLN